MTPPHPLRPPRVKSFYPLSRRWERACPVLDTGAGVRVIPPPVIPANTGIQKTANPHSIESDHHASSSHEAPFPLPDDDIEPIDPDEVAFFNLSPSEREDASHPNSFPTDTPSVGAGFKPAHDPSSSHEAPFPLPDDDIEPVDPDEVAYFNLPPSERNNTPHPSASSAANPPAPKPPARLIASLFQKARPNPNDDHDTFPVKRF